MKSHGYGTFPAILSRYKRRSLFLQRTCSHRAYLLILNRNIKKGNISVREKDQDELKQSRKDILFVLSLIN